MNPELSIIVVHYRTPEVLKLCLASVGETLGGIDYEAIVVDSATTRVSQDVVKERFPKVAFLPFKENLGYSRGVNVGIKNSKGKYILILNPDIILTEGSVQKMLEYIKSHPDIGILGPKMLNFNGTHQKTYFNFYKPVTVLARRSGLLSRIKPFKKVLDDFLMSDTDPSEIQTPDWLMGSALMVSREALDKVGMMDERFFMYFEDVDWARRFWHNDYKIVYYPAAVMYHYHQRESKSRLGLLDAIFNKKTRWHIKSAIQFFLKYKSLAQPR
ncbi:MAG: glycosyltransferase family 2 protein [Candidatus Paceibacterota bacterium]